MLSSEGMRHLAANCMLIVAIGEGIKNVDKRTEGQLLVLCPDIPWHEVMAMRNHIAHGYFEIDTEFVYLVILKSATSSGKHSEIRKFGKITL